MLTEFFEKVEMSDWRLRKIENRITKKTLIAKRNLHHDMTSKIFLALYFFFLIVPVCIFTYSLINCQVIDM